MSKLPARSECLQLAHSPFVWIVDRLQTDILFILEEPIELRMLTVKGEFSQQKEDIFTNERSVTLVVSALSLRMSD